MAVVECLNARALRVAIQLPLPFALRSNKSMIDYKRKRAEISECQLSFAFVLANYSPAALRERRRKALCVRALNVRT